MLKKPIKNLKGKQIAIIAMGASQVDFHMAITHSVEFDEVWVVNAMIGVVPNPDRAFVMDPMSRYLDTEDAGDMTNMMRKVLPKLKCPIYTCVLDERIPKTELYPIESVIQDSACSYLNNTVAYAIAFAYWNKVGGVNIFGADFTYKSNLYFAEMGRGCCEHWLAKCMEKDIDVSISVRSNLLDSNVEPKEKLYGYHRLPDPIVSHAQNGKLEVCKWSEILQQNRIPVGIYGRNDPVEPNKY